MQTKHFMIEAFSAAILAGQLGRACGLASTMTDKIKEVAREIWESERNRPGTFIKIPAPF